MSDDNLLRVGRPVYIKTWDLVGKIYDYSEPLGLWLVEGTDGRTGAHTTDELDPLFRLEQVADIKLPDVLPGSDLVDKVKPFGMTSEELSDFSAEFIRECQGRIKGVGNKQYSLDGFQKFEALELDELLEYLEKEILDIPNYAAMLFIRVRRLRQAWNTVFDHGQGTEDEYAGGTVTPDDFEEQS